MLRLSDDEKRFIDTVGDPSRLKILLALWKSDQELRIYKICQFTGLGRSSVRRHLNNLVESGLVTRKIYEQIVLYSISKGNPKANALASFFKEAKL